MHMHRTLCVYHSQHFTFTRRGAGVQGCTHFQVGRHCLHLQVKLACLAQRTSERGNKNTARLFLHSYNKTKRVFRQHSCLLLCLALTLNGHYSHAREVAQQFVRTTQRTVLCVHSGFFFFFRLARFPILRGESVASKFGHFESARTRSTYFVLLPSPATGSAGFEEDWCSWVLECCVHPTPTAIPSLHACIMQSIHLGFKTK